MYARMGVQEYYFFTPNPDEIPEAPRLLGWREINGRAIPIEPDEQGRLWSEFLQSWLVSDGYNLRLYDRSGHRRLTEAEAERKARSGALAAADQALAQAQDARTAAQEAQAARRAAEARSARLEALLKARGIDTGSSPDDTAP